MNLNILWQVTNVQTSGYFFASVHVNLINIYGAYINCVPGLRLARVVNDLDIPIIKTLMVHFLAAARSRLRWRW